MIKTSNRPALVDIDNMILDGAKQIPTKLVKRLLKEYERDADGHQKLIDKLEETIKRYG